MKLGQLPDEADRTVWREVLVREQRAQDHARVLMVTVIVILAVSAALLGGRAQDRDPAWLGWTLAAVLAGLAVALPLLARRRARRLRRLSASVS